MTLPAAPSRIGDPDNFGSEATAFLAALPSWRTSSNTQADTANALPVNKNNWGTIADTNPTVVTLTAMPTQASTSSPGLTFTSREDAFRLALQSFSAVQDSFFSYLSALSALTGVTVFVSDPTRPVISQIATAPARGQNRATYNANANAFNASAATYVTNCISISDWFYDIIEPEDWGLITDTVTETDDWGTI